MRRCKVCGHPYIGDHVSVCEVSARVPSCPDNTRAFRGVESPCEVGYPQGDSVLYTPTNAVESVRVAVERALWPEGA